MKVGGTGLILTGGGVPCRGPHELPHFFAHGIIRHLTFSDTERPVVERNNGDGISRFDSDEALPHPRGWIL